MRHTIGFKLTSLIIVIMVLSMVAAGLVSEIFLQKYYINKKVDVIMSVYDKVKELSAKDPLLLGGNYVEEMNTLCESQGVSLIIFDSSWEAVYQYGSNSALVSRGKDMILGNNRSLKEAPQTVKESDDYTIQLTEDKESSRQYYELYATLDSGNIVLGRMSVESFRKSMSISNKFYLGVGIALIVVTTLTIILITRRYTKPVLKLAEISTKMADLDFDTKYKGSRNDEIGTLGESMNHMSEKLETTISDLKAANLELQKDIAQKEEIDRMRTEFISNVSHELKTPIALIQGYAEGLQEGISDNPEDREYYCDVIIDEAGKMNHMVRQLLNLIHLEQGDNQITMERFDIVSVISGVISSMKIKTESAKVEISFNYTEPIYVWADEFQIEEVITNYLSNALNHVDENKQIHVDISEKNGIIRVSVFNTGKQIPDEDIENVWVKFYKVDKARTREYGGNGIGLSIVKAIMERHKKGYGVQNHDNGVEFWFELDGNANDINNL